MGSGGPIVTGMMVVAGAAAGVVLLMEPPRSTSAEEPRPASLTVINPVASQDAGSLQALATQLTARGEYSQAIEALCRAIEVEEGRADLHVQRGLLRLRLGDVEAARVDFNHALRIDEHTPGAVAGMGLAWLTEGEHEKAAKCFDLALSRDKTLACAWRGKGEVLAAADDHAAAVKAFNEAQHLDVTDPQIYVLRARSRSILKDNRGALLDAERAVELAPYDMDAWYTLGSLHLLRREFLETIQAADEALAIDPGSADMLALRAWARNERANKHAALRDAHAALKAAPEGWRHREAMEKLVESLSD